MMNSRPAWRLAEYELPPPALREAGKHPLRLYVVLFELLRISPTYELARKASCGRLTAKERQTLPSDFDRVKDVFAALGDVRQTFFAEWWRKRGLVAFGPVAAPIVRQLKHLPALAEADPASLGTNLDSYCDHERLEDGMPETLLLAVPIGRPDILREVQRVLHTYIANLQPQEPPKPRFELAKSFSSIDTDFLGRGVARIRVYARLKQPDPKRADAGYADWEIEALCRGPHMDEIAKQVRIGTWNVARVPGTRGETAESKARRTLSQSLNRYLRTFERYAENAARGVFPSDASVGFSNFDYAPIRHRLRRISQWERASMNRATRNGKT